ncbi:MAG: hypothetical protein ACRDIY_17770 [Chloroflexota bacterium]
MASGPEPVVLTYDDLVELPNDRNRYELFEGELQVTAAPNISHQATSGNLYFILTSHVRRYDLARHRETVSARPFPDLVIPLAETWGW